VEEFVFLDEESEKLLEKILQHNDMINTKISGLAIDFLVTNGYLKGVEATTLSDKEPSYFLTGYTQKGKTYFELKKRYEKEKRRISRREWLIGIFCTIIGAIIGLIPTIIQLFT